MMTTTLGSILIGSADPDRLRAWYLEAFGMTANEFGVLGFGSDAEGAGAILVNARDDVAATTPEPGRHILNFHVDDAHAAAARLTAMGVSWLVEIEDRGPGIFGTIVDPDGNYVQIIQFSQAYHDASRKPADMFENTKAFSGFSVDDIEAAANFYGKALGLHVTEENGMLHLHIAGGRDTLVYPKTDHTPATYTILNFPVADIDAAVSRLTERGVVFEPVDGADENGIFRKGGPLIAWFKDPAGNWLSVLQTG
jgi:predicted enzyme related to lactoylglutathione lyase